MNIHIDHSIAPSFPVASLLPVSRLIGAAERLEGADAPWRNLDPGALAAYRGFAGQVVSDIEQVGLGFPKLNPPVVGDVWDNPEPNPLSEPIAEAKARSLDKSLEEMQRAQHEANRAQYERRVRERAAVETLARHFDELDRSGRKNNLFSLQDLQVALEKTNNEELRAAIRVVLANPALLAELDVANKTIDTNPDQKYGRKDLEGWLRDNPLPEAPSSQGGPGPRVLTGPGPSAERAPQAPAMPPVRGPRGSAL